MYHFRFVQAFGVKLNTRTGVYVSFLWRHTPHRVRRAAPVDVVLGAAAVKCCSGASRAPSRSTRRWRAVCASAATANRGLANNLLVVHGTLYCTKVELLSTLPELPKWSRRDPQICTFLRYSEGLRRRIASVCLQQFQ